MKCFCDDVTRSTGSGIPSTTRNTVNVYFNKFRIEIFGTFLQKRRNELRRANRMKAISESKEGKVLQENPVFWATVIVCQHNCCAKEALIPVMQGKIPKCFPIHTNGLILNAKSKQIYERQDYALSHKQSQVFLRFCKEQTRKI